MSGGYLTNCKSEHRIHRSNWLRAAVLGANDGIISTASLILGIASAGASTREVLVTGIAGLLAGAMSMAAGEYVSVSSQADTELADLEIEKRHLSQDYDYEIRELTQIYIDRGLETSLAKQVAIQLMQHNALEAHARDELGISHNFSPKPFQAAAISCATFALGAMLPLLAALLSPPSILIIFVAISTLSFLALLGIISAVTGGAAIIPALIRVTFWGGLAMAVTSLAGLLIKFAL